MYIFVRWWQTANRIFLCFCLFYFSFLQNDSSFSFFWPTLQAPGAQIADQLLTGKSTQHLKSAFLFSRGSKLGLGDRTAADSSTSSDSTNLSYAGHTYTDQHNPLQSWNGKWLWLSIEPAVWYLEFQPINWGRDVPKTGATRPFNFECLTSCQLAIYNRRYNKDFWQPNFLCFFFHLPRLITK